MMHGRVTCSNPTTIVITTYMAIASLLLSADGILSSCIRRALLWLCPGTDGMEVASLNTKNDSSLLSGQYLFSIWQKGMQELAWLWRTRLASFPCQLPNIFSLGNLDTERQKKQDYGFITFLHLSQQI